MTLSPHLAHALASRYRLERELGVGGMATVYLAEDLKHGRKVAIKVLDPQLAQVAGVDRFIREIQVLSTLQHPNILPLFDSGEAAGELYYVMPYVEGETLRARLVREKRLGVEESVRVATEVASALDYAHRRGVVHRDIKPDNILLSDGHALVADFGIARALLSDPGAAQRLTATGISLGTPGYMSPEQAAGDPGVDARADVYALGAVTYEMLAGQAPFTGPSAQALLARVLTDTPTPLAQVRRGISPAINDAVQRSLAIEPSDRFPVATAFAEALQRATQGSARPRLRRSTTVALGVAIAALTAISTFWPTWRGAGSPDQRSGVRVAVIPLRDVGVVGIPGFSEGLTAALRRDLATIPNVDVVAGASVDALGDSARNPRTVAAQLLATHVLTGTVQWSGTDGAIRFRVAPEVIDFRVGGDRVSAGEPIEGQVDGLFQTQARLSTQMARSLGVPLSAEATTRLARSPTRIRAAYEAYLRATLQLGEVSPGNAMLGLRSAVALDSTFVEAWAALGQMAAFAYRSDPRPATAELAQRASTRALALDSNNTAARLAALLYERHVARNFPAALRHGREAIRVSRGDAEATHFTAAVLFHARQFDEALLLAKRGAELDPRSASAVNRVANILHWMRNYEGAEDFGSRAIALDGRRTGYINLDSMWLPLVRGDTAAAHRFARSLADTSSRADMAQVAARDWLQGWALDDESQRLGEQALRQSVGSGSRALYYVVAAQRAWIARNTKRLAVMVDSADRVADEMLRRTPREELLRVGRGYALALGGRCDAGIAQADSANATRSVWDDGFLGAGLSLVLAEVLAVCGRADRALSLADTLLRTPGLLTREWLRVDPHFAGLRADARFQRLTAGR
ncbi:MAG: protein kinase [Gemmatimonadetes bacterium]|nr:protein kinase [Gemmatimonadota bacterium]